MSSSQKHQESFFFKIKPFRQYSNQSIDDSTPLSYRCSLFLQGPNYMLMNLPQSHHQSNSFRLVHGTLDPKTEKFVPKKKGKNESNIIIVS